MSMVSSILGAAGNTVQGMGSYAQGLEQSYAYKYNARMNEIQAEEAKVAGEVQVQQITEEGESLASTQRMMYAKSGIMLSGSALDVIERDQAKVEFDKLATKYNTNIEVRGYLSQAQQNKNAAKMAKVGGTVGLVGGILGGAGQVAGGIAGGSYGSPSSSSGKIATYGSKTSLGGSAANYYTRGY